MLLQAKGVSYAYAPDKQILRDVNASFSQGQMYAILGESGSGKTTFLSLLAGLDVPTKGSVIYKGTALERGISSASARRIRSASFLHDAGKVAIPAAILYKPGKLDAREFEVIKTHTTAGAELFSGVAGEWGAMLRAVCLWHHEHHNGGGYWGKTPRELPPYLPIISIADVYAALISPRAYKAAWPKKQALEHIGSLAGTQFAPELVKLFVSLIRNDKRVPAIFTEVIK